MKTGFVCIVGLPNAGKSTLINSLTGEKVAIVSWRPNTTRNRILGIVTTEDRQIVFIDTPGIFTPKNKLGDYMMQSVTYSMKDIECMLYVIDASKGVQKADYEFFEKYAAKYPIIVAVNKTDCITRETLFIVLEKLNHVENLNEIIPICAKKGENLDTLLKLIDPFLQTGIQMFPEDMYTDNTLRFMSSEIIREKTLYLLNKEVPYELSVQVNKFEFREDSKGKREVGGDSKSICEIDANIICEKQSHKGIIIGKGGQMLKKIATEARHDIEDMLQCKVYLTLFVKVDPDWRDNDYLLREYGYDKKDLK